MTTRPRSWKSGLPALPAIWLNSCTESQSLPIASASKITCEAGKSTPAPSAAVVTTAISFPPRNFVSTSRRSWDERPAWYAAARMPSASAIVWQRARALVKMMVCPRNPLDEVRLYSSVVICLMVGIFCLRSRNRRYRSRPTGRSAYWTRLQFSFLASVFGEPIVAERYRNWACGARYFKRAIMPSRRCPRSASSSICTSSITTVAIFAILCPRRIMLSTPS